MHDLKKKLLFFTLMAGFGLPALAAPATPAAPPSAMQPAPAAPVVKNAQPGQTTQTASVTKPGQTPAATAKLPPVIPYRLLGRIPAPDGAGHWNLLSIDQKNRRLLLAHGDTIMSMDLTNYAVNDTLAIADTAYAVVPINDGAQLLITNRHASAIAIVDGKTGQPVANLPTNFRPVNATYDPSTGLALVMLQKDKIVLIDAKTYQQTATIDVPGLLGEAAVDGNGKAYVAIRGKESEVAVLDLHAAKVLNTFHLACSAPAAIGYDGADKLLAVVCDGSLEVINAANGALVKKFIMDGGADDIAYDATNNLAFIPTGKTGALWIYAISKTGSHLVQTVNTQTYAYSVALDPATGRLYLPTAKFGPQRGKREHNMLTGSFGILAVGKQ